MTTCGCEPAANPPADPQYRRVLWIALVLNGLMFGVELAASFSAQSVSLLADAVDFLGDAGNYAVALFVLGLAPVWRSRTALWKGWLMLGYGVFVLAKIRVAMVDRRGARAVDDGCSKFACSSGQRRCRGAAVSPPRR